jgi:hypothetical protein
MRTLCLLICFLALNAFAADDKNALVQNAIIGRVSSIDRAGKSLILHVVFCSDKLEQFIVRRSSNQILNMDPRFYGSELPDRFCYRFDDQVENLDLSADYVHTCYQFEANGRRETHGIYINLLRGYFGLSPEDRDEETLKNWQIDSHKVFEAGNCYAGS